MKSPNPKKHTDGLPGILEKLTPDEARLLSQVMGRDPFADLYKRTLVIYVIILNLIVFWPFDFAFTGKKNHVRWIDGTEENPSLHHSITPTLHSPISAGLEFTGEGQVISRSPSRPFFERLVSGKGFSLEVWVRPADSEQTGPARIVSYSLNPSLRNFTLGQQGEDLIMRLRTSKTNLNGTEPMLRVEDVFAKPKPLHIVVSYDLEEQMVFVNGDLRISADIPGGDFKNWHPSHRLILGNEATGDRPWLGQISYVAIYDRPLDAREVRRSYHEVRDWVSGTAKTVTAIDGLVTRYLLDEKEGVSVTDSGTLAEPLPLHIPVKIETESKPFLEFSLDRSSNANSGAFAEMVLNILLFIPLGFLLYALAAGQVDGTGRALLFVMMAGGSITFGIEILQYFTQSRHSSLMDVVFNLGGAMTGGLLKLGFEAYLRGRRFLPP